MNSTEGNQLPAERGLVFPAYRRRQVPSLSKEKQDILDQINAPPALKKILLSRGMDVAGIGRYVKSSESLFNPDAILNMESAARIIIDTMKSGTGLGIFGDYDVDGATSTSQIFMFLRDLVSKNERYLSGPLSWRIGKREGGYGPYPAATKELHDEGCQALLILDSGTVANDYITRAREHGFSNIIVVDHHQPGDNWIVPDALIVNPHQPDDTSGFTDLCTAGLVWCLLKKLTSMLKKDTRLELPNLDHYAALAALGSVVDMMPMNGMNRGLVLHGLSLEHHSAGIQSLKSASGIEEAMNSGMCGWKLGPCINSGGRISDSSLGTRLFVQADDDFSAEMDRDEIAKALFNINEERKGMKNAYLKQAKERLVTMKPDHGVIILEDESWHPGLVGLVASEPLRQYGLPCIAIGAGGKGSARSIGSFDIGHMLIEARNQGLLLSGGGHHAAGGLTLNPEKKQEFLDYVAEKSKNVTPEPVMIDHTVTCNDIGEHFIIPLEQAMEPVGQQNPSPVFLLVADVKSVGRTKGGNIKMRLRDETGEVTVFAWCKQGELFETLSSLAPDENGMTMGVKFVLRITHIPFTTMIIEDLIHN